VTSLQVLGFIVNDKLTAADHVTMLLSSCSSLLYAMRVRCSHGTPTTSLHDIFRATVILRIKYAASPWSGLSSATDRARLDSLLRCGKRLGYCSNDMPTVNELFNSADDDFLYSVKTNSAHVLQHYLPDQTNIPYPSPHSLPQHNND